MKKIKIMPLIIVAVCAVLSFVLPQFAFSDVREFTAQTNFAFELYTPDPPGPTPGPTPTPTPTPTGGSVTAQTGDALIISIILVCLVLAVTLYFAYRLYAKRDATKRITKMLGLLVPVVLAGGYLSYTTNAYAAEQETHFTNEKIVVIVNSEGGPVSYGDGETSNVQKFTNNSDTAVYIDKLTLDPNDKAVDIGTWTATLKDGTKVFKGKVGDTFKLDEPIVLKMGESFEVTWETSATSEDLMDVVGQSPVHVSYMTYDAMRQVSFESNGGSDVPSQQVIYGSCAKEPTDPTLANCDFVYWTSDAGLEHEFDFGTKITDNITLYAKWHVTEEYVEEKEAEAEEETQAAFDNIELISGLTPDEIEFIKDQIQDLLDQTKQAIENADQPGDVDKIMQDFKDEVLNIEKDALKGGAETYTDQIQEQLKDIPGLTPDDKARYKKQIEDAFDAAKQDIDESSDFDEASGHKEQYEKDTKDLLQEAIDLGQKKDEVRAFNEEQTKAAKDDVDDYAEDLQDATVTKYKKQIQDYSDQMKKNINAATSTEEVEQLKKDQQKFLQDLFAEIENIITTRAEETEKAKKSTDEFPTKLEQIQGITPADITRYQAEVEKKYPEILESLATTDNADDLKEIGSDYKNFLDQKIKDAKELVETRAEAKQNIENKIKTEKDNLESRTDLNPSEVVLFKKEIDSLYKKMQRNIDRAPTKEEVTKVKEDIVKQIDAIIDRICVVQLNSPTGSNFADSSGNPLTHIAAHTGNPATVYFYVTDTKKQLASLKDNLSHEYTLQNNCFSFTFNKDLTTISATLEDKKEEAYSVILSSTNGADDILEFRFDDKRQDYKDDGYTTFDLTTSGYPQWHDYLSCNDPKVKTINFDKNFENARPKSCYCWFGQSASHPSITAINGLEYLNTEEVVNLQVMFSNCSLITTPDVSKFKTTNCVNFAYIFSGCSKMVTPPDVSGWDVSNAERLDGVFKNCESMSTCPNVSNWKTGEQACSLEELFVGCKSLKYVDELSKAQFPNIKNNFGLASMFESCSSLLKAPDLSSWDLPEGIRLGSLFSKCTSLVDCSNLKNYKVKNSYDMNYMFNSCTSLKTVDISKWKSTSSCSFEGMFWGCNQLESVDIRSLSFSSETACDTPGEYGRGMFEGCKSLKTIIYGNDISDVLTDEKSADMFNECTALEDWDGTKGRTYAKPRDPDAGIKGYFTPPPPEGYAVITTHTTKDDTLEFRYDGNRGNYDVTFDVEDTGTGDAPWVNYLSSSNVAVTNAVVDSAFSAVKPKSLVGWFKSRYIQNISGLEHIDTSEVTSMYSAFRYYPGTSVEGISGWDVSKCSDFSYMFSECRNLVEGPDLSSWKPSATSSSIDFYYCFDYCSSMKTVNVDFSIAKERSLKAARIFGYCSKLETIYCSRSWVDYLEIGGDAGMFRECEKLPHFTEHDPRVVDRTYAYPDNGTDGYFTMPPRQAYAAIESSQNGTNDTFTLYYDSNRGSKNKTYDIPEMDWMPGWVGEFSGDDATVTSVVVDESFKDYDVKSCFSWFGDFNGGECKKVTSYTNLNYLNVSNVRNLSYMFCNNTALVTPPDISEWDVSNVVNLERMFFNCKKMASIPDFSKWKFTKEINSMQNMFNQCCAIKNADSLSGIETVSFKTEALKNLFWQCYSLEKAPDLGGWNLPENIALFGVFCDDNSLTDVSALNNWKVKNATNLYALFLGVGAESFDLSNWTTSTSCNYQCMFGRCSSAKSIDISNFSFTSSTVCGGSSAMGMFHTCSSLTTIFYDEDVSGVLDSETSNFMFDGCYSLPHFQEHSPYVTDRTYAYPNDGTDGYFTPSQPTVQLKFDDEAEYKGHFEDEAGETISSGVITGDAGEDVKIKIVVNEGGVVDKVTDNGGHEYVLQDDGFYHIVLSANSTITVTTKPAQQAYAVVLSSTNGSNDILDFRWDANKQQYIDQGLPVFDIALGEDEYPLWKEYTYSDGATPSVTTVNFENSFQSYLPTTCKNWFHQNPEHASIKSINNASNLNVADVTSFDYMFCGCANLESAPDTSNWQAHKNTTFAHMFEACKKITNFDPIETMVADGLPGSEYQWAGMKNMFQDCVALTKYPKINWKIPTRADIDYLFYNCYSVTDSSNLTNWKTGLYLRGMQYMFYNNHSVQTIDISNWTSSAPIYTSHAFAECTALKSIDMSALSIDSYSSLPRMFENCTSLEKIYYYRQINPQNSYYMFNNCTSLTNWKGSVDKTYAYPDNGVTGYFTSKTPTVELKFATEGDGHFEDAEGNTITSATGNLGSKQNIKVVLASGKTVTSIKNNAEGTYQLVDGSFELKLDACYTVTVTTDAAEVDSLQTAPLINNDNNEITDIPENIPATTEDDAAAVNSLDREVDAKSIADILIDFILSLVYV